MNFRLKAFGLHFLGSLCVLGLVLGGLYVGWYRWPGWYLTGVTKVLVVMAGVDLALGPLLTLVVASPAKASAALRRDIAVIVSVQLVALVYGATQLWGGRPLYYAYSETVLQVIQAYDIDPQEADGARAQNLELAPHWYTLPRWIWAPLPSDQKTHDAVLTAAISGGNDVTAIPRYYRPWNEGLATLRGQLKKLDELRFFGAQQKTVLKERMLAAGLDPGLPNAIPMTGRGLPLLAVLDPQTLKILALLRSD
jgi:hypothetical protein